MEVKKGFQFNIIFYFCWLSKKMYRLLFILILLTSCQGFNPNRMFKTPKGYEFAKDTTVSSSPLVYLIQPGDKLALKIYSNDGFKLVDITSTNYNNEGNSAMVDVTFSVDNDSTVKLPIIGRISVVGLSVREGEKLLEQLYSKYYNDPFIIIKVTNRNAIVFLNDQGRGTVVDLNNDNTTLYEALAKAGGIGEYSKSYRIKILRGDPKNPKVFLADISTIEGLKTSELRVLSNDIIYVDAGSRFTKRLAADVLPVIGIISSILLVVSYINQ